MTKPSKRRGGRQGSRRVGVAHGRNGNAKCASKGSGAEVDATSGAYLEGVANSWVKVEVLEGGWGGVETAGIGGVGGIAREESFKDTAFQGGPELAGKSRGPSKTGLKKRKKKRCKVRGGGGGGGRSRER